ncbi:Acetaldehyde dehydrogenase [Gossypium arboreum]|uniref:Acetaldehyde dehydrogenase n=1 Tax=Gossypium arboreum TaxID=29729 RepID=A0A0B0PLE3_GOSAR|nr:Acetaldehyde dehydrogenase [Gossypium arboreum]
MNDIWPRLLFINHVIPVRGYHSTMSRAMNSTIVNEATYCRSHTPNAPIFDSLSIRTQAFTYIKVYELCIYSPPCTQDLGMPHYEHHK